MVLSHYGRNWDRFMNFYIELNHKDGECEMMGTNAGWQLIFKLVKWSVNDAMVVIMNIMMVLKMVMMVAMNIMMVLKMVIMMVAMTE